MQEDDDLDFVVPKEGTLINSDCLCIPRGAPRPDNAHRFINYLLDAKVGADISNTIMYTTPNGAALALMPRAASIAGRPIPAPTSRRWSDTPSTAARFYASVR